MAREDRKMDLHRIKQDVVAGRASKEECSIFFSLDLRTLLDSSTKTTKDDVDEFFDLLGKSITWGYDPSGFYEAHMEDMELLYKKTYGKGLPEFYKKASEDTKLSEIVVGGKEREDELVDLIKEMHDAVKEEKDHKFREAQRDFLKRLEEHKSQKIREGFYDKLNEAYEAVINIVACTRVRFSTEEEEARFKVLFNDLEKMLQ